MPTLSIIIPTLNEAANLSATLERLDRACEVLVIDAGSSDATCEIAEKHGATLISTEKRGRAKQMNLGAKTATGEVLLFLHGDTLIPEAAIENMLATLHANPQVIGGSFERYFDSPSRFLAFTCLLATWRARQTGVFLGDQGIFVRRERFSQLGGFLETLPFGEDVDFSMRLKKTGITKTITPAVLTSARRFDQSGPLLRTVKDFWLFLQILRLRR